MRDAADDPHVRMVVEGLGVDMPSGSVEAFGRTLETDRQRWGEVVKASGFTMDK
jgi:tripartite-type tricarboxylate transporter receptor subunit TctC